MLDYQIICRFIFSALSHLSRAVFPGKVDVKPVISIKFLLVIAMLCKTEWSWELRTWSQRMCLLDILSTSPHYFYSKWIGATKENVNFNLRVQRVKQRDLSCSKNKTSGLFLIFYKCSHILLCVRSWTKQIERFNMTSRPPYWCLITMKRQPCWCSKPVLWELKIFVM